MLLVALTGWGQPQHHAMTQEAGFDIHLVKPVSIDQLGFILSMTSAFLDVVSTQQQIHLMIDTEMLRCTNSFGTVELSPPCLH